MKEISGIIEGELASKSNSRVKTRDGRFIKSPKAREFETSALWQLKPQVRGKPIEGDVVLEATIYYRTRRPDLDESLLMDILEKAGVYHNDRQVRQKNIIGEVDKHHPRIEFSVFQREG